MVATVLVLVSIGRGDVGVDEQREKLTALDQLSVGARLVGLDVEQEPSGSQDVGGVDDSRSLLVLRDERWSARLGRIEERGIVMGDLEELAGRDLISPDLGHARVVAGVLVHDDAPEPIDRHVVEHAVSLGALQEHLDRAAELGTLDVIEAQAP